MQNNNGMLVNNGNVYKNVMLMLTTINECCLVSNKSFSLQLIDTERETRKDYSSILDKFFMESPGMRARRARVFRKFSPVCGVRVVRPCVTCET